MTKYFSLPVWSVLLLIGCATYSKPPNNADFASIQKLKEIEGTYQNLGISEKNSPPVYLSRIIWQNVSGIDHGIRLVLSL